METQEERKSIKNYKQKTIQGITGLSMFNFSPEENKRGSRRIRFSITGEKLKSSSSSRRSANSIETFSSDSNNQVGDTLTGLEAVRHAFLSDKKNHFLRCTMLTLAAKRSKKQIKQTDKLLAYQHNFFKKRGKKPTIDDIIALGNAIKRFSNKIHQLYDITNKKKISAFLKWKLVAFGFRKQLMKQLNVHFEQKFESSYKRAKKRI